MSSSSKLPLPTFLKVLNNGGLSMPNAMAVASKIYKTHNSPSTLGLLKDSQLKSLGVEAKEDRRLVLAALKQAGYKTTPQKTLTLTTASSASTSVDTDMRAEPSSSSSSNTRKRTTTSTKTRKRIRTDADVNELLPDGPQDEGIDFGSFEFNEVMDEEVLKTKSAIINRAPVMTAWATVVAERLGFGREEALSIAAAYTEMNSISKGVAIGVFEQSKGKGVEIAPGESQPYVDLLGRRAVYSTQEKSEWRALVKRQPVTPSTAFAYMTRAFRQTLPYIMGALRLLADTYAPGELNKKGFGLYAEFRPDVGGWGNRGEIKCETILSLRKHSRATATDEQGPDPGTTGIVQGSQPQVQVEESQPSLKNIKTEGLTWEEYEASLDDSGFLLEDFGDDPTQN